MRVECVEDFFGDDGTKGIYWHRWMLWGIDIIVVVIGLSCVMLIFEPTIPMNFRNF